MLFNAEPLERVAELIGDALQARAKTEYQFQGFSPERFHFGSILPGPHFVGTTRIHGNEPSGSHAFYRLASELVDSNNPLRLKRGSITLYTNLNPLAAFNNVRSLGVDGNRSITKIASLQRGETYERVLGGDLALELAKIQRRSLLAYFQPWHHGDYHDVPTRGAPHVLPADKPASLEVAKAIGLPTVIKDWRTAQLNVSDEELQAIGRTRQEQRDFTQTLIYAAEHFGAASSVCVEAGYNKDGQSDQVAYEALRSQLAYLGILEPFEDAVHTVHKKPEIISIKQTIFRRNEDEKLVDPDIRDDKVLEPGTVIVAGGGRTVVVPDKIDPHGFWRAVHPIPDTPERAVPVGDHLVHLAWVSRGL